MANNTVNTSLPTTSTQNISQNTNGGWVVRITSVVNQALDYLTSESAIDSASEPRVVLNLTSTSSLVAQASPPTVSPVVHRRSLADVQAQLKTVENWNSRIGLLHELVDIAGKNEAWMMTVLGETGTPQSDAEYHRCRNENAAIALLFIEELKKLPEEQLFPVHADPLLKSLFKQVDKKSPRTVVGLDQFYNAIVGYCKTLSPEQEERFLKLLPINYMDWQSPATIRELSHRYYTGELSEAQWDNHHQPSDLYRWFHWNTPLFFQNISVPLLEKILKSSDHISLDLNHETVKAFQSMPLTADTYYKFLLMVNWYSTQASEKNLPQKDRAISLFCILTIANNLFDKVKIFQVIQRQETTRLTRTELHFLALLPVVPSWIPKIFRDAKDKPSWDKFTRLVKIQPDKPEMQAIKKYFD
jgi:hypothetical protein